MEQSALPTAPGSRVYVIGRDRSFVDALTRLLATEPGWEVVGQAFAWSGAWRDLGPQLTGIDLLLVDYPFPAGTGPAEWRRLRERPLTVYLLLLTPIASVDYLGAGRLVGADRIVAKTDLGATLLPLLATLPPGRQAPSRPAPPARVAGPGVT